ncbi:MAG TPA: hypothetical protein VG778_01725, partial [Blastocatellia bacterium]|nr:hypothetical protein [Blastocatellia bacterium]
MALQNLLHYFRDCYEADNKRTTIWNIFHSGVEHRIFMDGREDILTGVLPEIPIDVEQGNAINKAAYLYRREKELIYCSLFIVGWVKVQEGAVQAICAPMLFTPAEILERDSATLLRPDPYGRQLNHRLIDCLQDSDEVAAPVERLAEILCSDFVTFDRVVAAAELLESLAPELDCGAVLNSYPGLIGERDLLTAFNESKANPDSGLRLLPSSVVALVKKSAEIRGVLNELSDVARIGEPSEPLKVLLGDHAAAKSKVRRTRIGRVPAVLSQAQTEIVRKAGTNPVTLVNGPPGTGKSYTIAALAMEYLSQGQSVLIAS